MQRRCRSCKGGALKPECPNEFRLSWPRESARGRRPSAVARRRAIKLRFVRRKPCLQRLALALIQNKGDAERSNRKVFRCVKLRARRREHAPNRPSRYMHRATSMRQSRKHRSPIQAALGNLSLHDQSWPAYKLNDQLDKAVPRNFRRHRLAAPTWPTHTTTVGSCSGKGRIDKGNGKLAKSDSSQPPLRRAHYTLGTVLIN